MDRESIGRTLQGAAVAMRKFYEFMLPSLVSLGDGQSRHWREIRDACVAHFRFTADDKAETLASGQTRLDNRVQWATTYLFQAGLIDRPSRAHSRITDRGRTVLAEAPPVITPDYLRRFPEFLEFKNRSRSDDPAQATAADDAEAATALDAITAVVVENSATLRKELLQRILAQPSEFFEKLVLTLLAAMGYGGQEADAVEHTGRSHDGGIDGVIKQDPLGIDRVYLQAKRYTDTVVGSPDMQKFVGALHGRQADRGVFITTSTFSKEARSYVEHIANRIVLIDGTRLVELMESYNVGVRPEQTITLKSIDENFFE